MAADGSTFTPAAQADGYALIADMAVPAQRQAFGGFIRSLGSSPEQLEIVRRADAKRKVAEAEATRRFNERAAGRLCSRGDFRDAELMDLKAWVDAQFAGVA